MANKKTEADGIDRKEMYVLADIIVVDPQGGPYPMTRLYEDLPRHAVRWSSGSLHSCCSPQQARREIIKYMRPWAEAQVTKVPGGTLYRFGWYIGRYECRPGKPNGPKICRAGMTELRMYADVIKKQTDPVH